MKIRVMLVDDHTLFRDGLGNLLAADSGIEIVGEASDGAAAVKAAATLRPDLVIMDISMPGLNGLEATRQILAANPQTRIAILSMHSDRRYVVEALKAGASGYLLKDSAVDELLVMVDKVSRGETYLSQRISDLVVREFLSMAPSDPGSAFAVLSAREREVLQKVAEGKSTKEIASVLNVSVKTVETHRKQIMDKLDLHSVAELTKYAIREGLTQID